MNALIAPECPRPNDQRPRNFQAPRTNRNGRFATGMRFFFIWSLVLGPWTFAPQGRAIACPFCTTPEPTFAERRESSDVVLIAEAGQSIDGRQSFKIHRVLKTVAAFPTEESLSITAKAPVGTLAMLLGKRGEPPAEAWEWHVVPVDETSLVYFVNSPSTRLPAATRLPYFVRYLEHADSLIATDAYSEFGRAPYDAVAAVADRLPMAEFRQHLSDPAVPGERKGFYGLALGLAHGDDDRRANRIALEEMIEKPASDFRAGFDGVIGGYLLLTAESGLQVIEQRFLTNTKAARGDVLHVMTALRFYHEYGRAIPTARLAIAMSHLLDRPEYTAAAVIDMARWEAWGFVPQVSTLWNRPGYEDRAIRRAVVGYLQNCPSTDAMRRLAQLRREDPMAVAEAEKGLSTLGTPR